MMLRFARIGPAPAVLCAAIAAVCLALPVRAQEAGEDTAGEPEASVEAPEQAPEEGDGAAPPEDAGADPAAAGEEPQDPAAGAATGETAGEAAEDPAGGPVVVDVEEGSVLDDQTFEGVDDDFIPSEEIPIDQPIPFPTDI